jgi:acetolactate synthase small subunit
MVTNPVGGQQIECTFSILNITLDRSPGAFYDPPVLRMAVRHIEHTLESSQMTPTAIASPESGVLTNPVSSAPAEFDATRDLPTGFMDFFLPLHRRFTPRQQQLAHKRTEILQLCQVFRARALDVGPDTLVVEVTGTQDKIEGLLAILEPFGVLEMVQSGTVAMTRGDISSAAKQISQERPRIAVA